MNTAAPPSLAQGRIRQAPSHCVIMSSLDPPQSRPGWLASANPHEVAPCLQRKPALSRNQSQAIVAGERSIEPCRGRPRPATYRRLGHSPLLPLHHECIAAVADLWFGGTGNSLIAARPARDIATRPAKPVASCRGGSREL